ncbi:hypothetical protein D1631_16580 [Chryseobacterium nematophagum]|uniref:Lipocalin-like domain-containing protein n=1 Tax=Chryseobacterium nematophagum TaxID=2305228 RepID=A0A3M7TJG5_9FLAO|nr:lipocalin family protein [Chryseobacterium nematophagum]RNA63418.1 hypothetical protein D1631_16580 [Chryseobacterium nematophagum]
MKFLMNLIVVMMLVSSCSNDDSRQDTAFEIPNINGTWKPSRYEYKGKVYSLSECEKNGLLLVNTDFSGVYEKFGVSPIDNNCNKFISFAGKWSYDAMNRVLTLTYKESGDTKTLTKEVEDFSDVELKILDNSKDLDGIPGNDEATLIFTKQ